MKNPITLLKSGFVLFTTMLALAVALLVSAQAGTYNVDGKRVIVKGFIKTATRVCDKITYTLKLYVLTDGGPTHVSISDNLAPPLLPTSPVTITGSSPPIGLITSNTSAGWNVSFDTPNGAGTLVSNYTLTFTSKIDPAAIVGSEVKVGNQAKILLGKTGSATEYSDDPSVNGENDSTNLVIPVAELKACIEPPHLETKSCLKGDAKVTCGKVYGTYDITLSVTGAGGVIPSFVTITPTTPGISLVPVLAQYPVVGGLVHITVVGATPGQVLTFDVQGMTTGAGSVEGTNLCCNGKISVTIPKNLECPPPPTKVEIKKYCDPIRKDPGDLKASTYSSICHIKVTTTGVINYPINISEVLSGTGTVSYLSSADPWSCLPPTVTSPVPMNCTLPANTMSFPSDVSIIDVKVTFATLADAKKAHNCATGTYHDERLRKSCTEFHPDDGKVDIEKTCEPLRPEPDGPVLGQGLTTRCKITVHTTGPITYHLNVAEVLNGTGTVGFYSSSPASVWTCTPFTANAPTPINCVANGGLNNTSSTSEFEFDVHFSNAAAANASENCGVVTDPVHTAQKSCVPLGRESTVNVDKVCDPVSYHKYPVNDHATGIGYVSMCHIKVTTTGPQTGVLSVGDSLTGGGTIVSANSSSTPAWNCTTLPNCTINGAVLNQSASTTYIDVMVVFASAGNAAEAKNCAILSMPGQASHKACTGFPPSTGKIDIAKICDRVQKTGDAVVTGYQTICHITVSTTGPQTGTITVSDVLAGAGTLGNASTLAPWICSTNSCQVNGQSLNQTSSTTVIDVPVNFPLNNDQSQEAKNCASVTVDGVSVGESCVPIVVDGREKFGSLTVTKAAIYDSNHIPHVNFPIAVTCGGSTANSSVQDGVPYTQNNIPLGTQCAVVETTIPQTGLCPEGQTERWDTSYSPSTPVTVANPTGTTIAIVNKLNCEPVDKGDVKITKVCDAVLPGQTNGGGNGFHAVCHITVTTNGTIANPGLTVGDLVQPINVVPAMSQISGPAWTCSGGNCSVTPALLGSNSISVFNTYIDFPDGAAVKEEHNCASTTGAAKVEACSPFTIKETPVDSDMYVKKVVVNNAPRPLTGMVYDITSTCSNTTQPTGFAHFVDGQTVLFHHYEAGMMCNLSEVISATTACGNDTPVWTTTYSPSQTVALSPNGETVTVTNTLDCKLVEPVGPTCGNGVIETPEQCDEGNLQNGDGCSSQCRIETGFTCKGSPSVCIPIGINKPTLMCDVKLAKLVGGACRCIIQGMVPISKTSCACPNGTSLKGGACRKDPPPPPVCKGNTHLEGKVCVENAVRCKPPAQRNPNTNTCFTPRPNCNGDTRWNGKACVANQKQCRLPLVLNKKTNTCFLPKPDCPADTHWNGKRCVPDVITCQPGTHLEGNKCVRDRTEKQKCARGEILTKRGCIGLPRCGPGQLPMPGTGVCFDVFKPKQRKQPETQVPGGGDNGPVLLPGIPGL